MKIEEMHMRFDAFAGEIADVLREPYPGERKLPASLVRKGLSLASSDFYDRLSPEEFCAFKAACLARGVELDGPREASGAFHYRFKRKSS